MKASNPSGTLYTTGQKLRGQLNTDERLDCHASQMIPNITLDLETFWTSDEDWTNLHATDEDGTLAASKSFSRLTIFNLSNSLIDQNGQAYMMMEPTGPQTLRLSGASACKESEDWSSNYMIQNGSFCLFGNWDYAKESPLCCVDLSTVWKNNKESLVKLLINTLQPTRTMRQFPLDISHFVGSLANRMVSMPQSMIDPWPMTHECLFSSGKTKFDCGDMFRMYPSASGLAHSFNLASSEDFQIFRTKLNEDENLLANMPPGDFVFSTMLLPNLGTELTDYRNNPKYKLSIHDRTTPPDFDLSGIDIVPRYEYFIKIEAKKNELNPTIAKMPFKVRGCLFPHEGTDIMGTYQNYSYSGCLNECWTKQLAERCNCLPWDIIRPPNFEHILPCSKGQLNCLQEAQNSRSPKGCDCPPDCEVTHYATKVRYRKIDPHRMCYQLNQKPGNFLKYHGLKDVLEDIRKNPYVEFTGNPWEHGSQSDNAWRCRSHMIRAARVSIFYESSTAQRTKKIPRLSFTDKVATIGK